MRVFAENAVEILKVVLTSAVLGPTLLVCIIGVIAYLGWRLNTAERILKELRERNFTKIDSWWGILLVSILAAIPPRP